MADDDLIQAIQRDHQEIASLLSAIDERADAATFEQLVRKIVVHETTEQEVVHPLVAKAPGGAAIARARLEEEAGGTEALERLQALGVDDPGFADAFAQFRRDVVAHAEHEEREEHPKLAVSVAHPRLMELGEIFQTEERSRIDESV